MGNHCFKAPVVQCGVDSCGGWGCMCEAPVPQYYNTSFEPADYAFSCTCQPRNSMLLAFAALGVAVSLAAVLCTVAPRLYFRLKTVRLLTGLAATFLLSGIILFAFGLSPYNRGELSIDPYDGCSGSAPLSDDSSNMPSADCDASYCSYPSRQFVALIFGVFTTMLLPGYGGK